MKDNSKIIGLKDGEYFNGKMEIDMKVKLKKKKCMEKGNIIIMMEKYMKVFL